MGFICWPASAIARARLRLFLGSLLVLAFAHSAGAQASKVHIQIVSLSSPRVRIEWTFEPATDVVSFRNTYAGVIGLGERVEMIAAGNQTRNTIPIKKLASGEYRATEKINRVVYEVRLDPPPRAGDLSHVSWLTQERGLLLLADLVPPVAGKEAGSPTAVQFELPSGWSVASALKSDAANQFVSNDPDKAVFLVSPSLRVKQRRLEAGDATIVSSGVWPFSESAALDSIGKILEHYTKVTGFALRDQPTVALLPFPGNAGTDKWTAETRGNTVVLLLGNNANRERALKKFGILLTHELFHFWTPNALALAGDYDWFFEGFTLYQALRTALTLKLIRFEDYLATLARVYDSYLATVDRDRLSLIDASARRWTVGSSLVYDKGMLVAFIYDLMLRSGNSLNSFDGLYAQLFRARSTAGQDANRVIMSILNQGGGMDFSARFVSGTEPLNPGPLLESFGLTIDRSTKPMRFLVSVRTKEQRELLRRLMKTP